MPDPQQLVTVSIAEQSARLSQPFTMVDLAQIDDLVLSIYLCQGTMPHHRHLDQDELFIVYNGVISLESDWGTAVLKGGELALVPKGLGHRSSSLLRSLVLLFQPRLMVNRRNGHRRLFTMADQGRLQKTSLIDVGRQIVIPFRPIVLVDVDTYALTVMLCKETGPWSQMDQQTGLVLCHSGHLDIDTQYGRAALGEWELAVIPRGMAHRLSSTDGALAVGVVRHRHPSLAARDRAE